MFALDPSSCDVAEEPQLLKVVYQSGRLQTGSCRMVLVSVGCKRGSSASPESVKEKRKIPSMSVTGCQQASALR